MTDFVSTLEFFQEDEDGNRFYKNEGQTLYINRSPSTGLWEVSVSSGIVPLVLRGKFTNLTSLQTAIKNYEDNKVKRVEYKKGYGKGSYKELSSVQAKGPKEVQKTSAQDEEVSQGEKIDG